VAADMRNLDGSRHSFDPVLPTSSEKAASLELPCVVEMQGAEAWLSAEAVPALAAWRTVAPQWPAEPDGEGQTPGKGLSCSATCRAAAAVNG